MARERKFSKELLYKTTKDALLNHGYEGFTFSKIADYLSISRGNIYKFYKNKEELITEYMVYEMELFLLEMKNLDNYQGFKAQLDYLIDIIFKDSEIHQIRKIAFQIPAKSKKVRINLKQLEKLHQDMYTYLQKFITLGREEKLLKSTIPDNVILGFILQTVDIPNHFNIPLEEWTTSIKEIICHGIFTEN